MRLNAAVFAAKSNKCEREESEHVFECSLDAAVCRGVEVVRLQGADASTATSSEQLDKT
jgi:hypothetical protein